MNRSILAAAGMALASACSGSAERPAQPPEDNLTRPLEVARVDTTQPLAPVEHQVTRPPESVTMPKPRKAKRAPKKVAPPPVATAPVPSPEEDTTVKGYAPDPMETALPDTASATTDTVSSSIRDTAASAAPDTTAQPAPDTVAARQPETVAARQPDSVTARRPDSVAARQPDSVAARQPDTVATGQPVPAATVAARTLPIGTEIHAALDDSINSRTDTTGRIVTAMVMENVTGSDGRTIIAAGAPVRFSVTRLSPARSKGAQGRLRLQVEGIGVGGELQKVSADVRPVPHELRGRGVTAGDAAKVGVGAAGGAVLGKVIGKNTKGAVIGGVIGAAGGAVVASQTATRDVVVKARTPVVFVLTQPLVAQ